AERELRDHSELLVHIEQLVADRREHDASYVRAGKRRIENVRVLGKPDPQVGLCGGRPAAQSKKRGCSRQTKSLHDDLPSVDGKAGAPPKRPSLTLSTPDLARTSVRAANAPISRSKATERPASGGVAATAGRSGQRWQAVAWPPASTSAGRSMRQRAIACGQRRCRWHPGGGLIGLGTSP